MKRVVCKATSLLLVVWAVLFGAQLAQAQDWQLVDGAARDVGVGANGTAWVIGTGAVAGGYEIYRRDPSGWTKIAGGAERIAVDPSGHPWVVNNAQALFRHDGANWIAVNRPARDVGVGGNGTVWVIGNDARPGGYGIYRSTNNGAAWTQVPGGAVRIAVDPAGNAWVINDGNVIFRYDGSNFVNAPGAGKDVAVGADGAVWIIGTDNSIYRWSGSTWTKKSGAGVQIAAGPGGVVWVVNAAGQIYKGQDQPEALALAAQPLNLTMVAPSAPAGPLQTVDLVSYRAPTPLPQGTLICPLLRGSPTMVVRGCTEEPRSNSAAVLVGTGVSNDNCQQKYARRPGYGASFVDPRNGGECWACPALLQRGLLFPVTSDRACSTGSDTGNIVWQSPQYPEPGVYAFFNGPLLKAAFADGKMVDAFLGRRANGNAQVKAQLWQRMAAAPGDSPEFKALIFAALVATAKTASPSTMTPTSAALGGFEDYMRARRTFVAKDALNMYNAWVPINAYNMYQAAGGASGFAGVGGLMGGSPGDYVSYAMGAAVPDARGRETLDAIQSLAGLTYVEDRTGETAGFTLDQLKYITSAISSASEFDKLGKAFSAFGLAAGLAGNVIDLASGIMAFTSQKDAEALYATLVSKADKPVSLTALYNSGKEADKMSLLLFWSLATSPYKGGGVLGEAPLNDTVECPQDSYQCGRAKAAVGVAAAMVGANLTAATAVAAAAPPADLTVTHGGGYVARLRVAYQQGGRSVTVVDDSNATLGWRRTFTIPADATNIQLQGWSSTGLAWEQWRSIIDKTYPTPTKDCVKVYNTTLDPKWNNECS